MEIYLVIVLAAVVLVGGAAFFIGKKSVHIPDRSSEIAAKDARIEELLVQVRDLTSQRDVSRANEENARKQLEVEKENALQAKAEAARQLGEAKAESGKQLDAAKADAARQLEEAKAEGQKVLEQTREDLQKQLGDAKGTYDKQLEACRDGYEKQLAAVKEESARQLEHLKQVNREQLDTQLNLIKEQMQTTSEKVLKSRQEELGAVNREQVSKIVDPLQQSLRQMSEALKDSKEKQQEALHKLDATIQANMKQNEHLTDSADRLARALTGEVKAQGNFGELKLRQLLEDLGLKEGEQFTSQQALRDRMGNAIKDDEGKNLIPDFILHFPNNRDVIVDSKMSFTAYERYMNTESQEEKSRYLQEHIASVRAQVKNLAGKDYSRYLESGYGKLNFVIMYIHTEGALNLALLNDGTLWREAYDKGVLVLGPQTMYMNLRILELMWTQVRQIRSQEDMMKCANTIISRVQLFAERFQNVEQKMAGTLKEMEDLKKVTAESGQSIVVAAKGLLKAGARVDKSKKKSGNIFEEVEYLEDNDTRMLEN